jgi:hypothetical protein
MAVQPPFRSDAYEVENADAPVGPRLIEASLLDGSIRFTDPRNPTGINLAELAGLQRAHNVIVVSQTGVAASKDVDGDPITTIQGGLDNVPDSADVNDPWLVLVMPGLYVEDVIWVKDGTTLRGLGGATLRESGAFSTIRMRTGPTTVPRRVRIEGLRIENATAAEACVDIDSSTFATGTFTIASVPNIGDVAEVDGTNLTAIANGSVPAPGEFELGLTVAETAANLALAINDPVNGLNTTVIASATGAVVLIRALQPGVAGNAITISSTVPLIIVASGATLTGGTAASPLSTVGDDLIEIIDCDLVATGASGFQVRASSVNNISIRGGDWRESSTTSFVDVRECAFLSLVELPRMFRAELHYDNTNPNLPSIGTSQYIVQRVTSDFTLASALVGVGSLTVNDSNFLTSASWSGDSAARTWHSTRCRYGAVTLGGTGTVTMSNCTRGALVAAGTGTLAESMSQGSAIFAAVPVVTVTFAEPQPDTSYRVLLESTVPPVAFTDIPFVTLKTPTSFDIVFGAPQVATIEFVVTRDI